MDAVWGTDRGRTGHELARATRVTLMSAEKVGGAGGKGRWGDLGARASTVAGGANGCEEQRKGRAQHNSL